MYIKQISVFVENKTGRLAKVTEVLKDNKINILALSIADTTNFGILRIIVDEPDCAEKVLKEDGFTVKVTNVIAICVPHTPGGLHKSLDTMTKAGIAIEYMYAFVGASKNDAMVIIKADNTEKALQVAKEAGINLIENSNIIK